jgi:hypothetical protein
MNTQGPTYSTTTVGHELQSQQRLDAGTMKTSAEQAQRALAAAGPQVTQKEARRAPQCIQSHAHTAAAASALYCRPAHIACAVAAAYQRINLLQRHALHAPSAVLHEQSQHHHAAAYTSNEQGQSHCLGAQAKANKGLKLSTSPNSVTHLQCQHNTRRPQAHLMNILYKLGATLA